MCCAGQAPCRRLHVTSNVRPRKGIHGAGCTHLSKHMAQRSCRIAPRTAVSLRWAVRPPAASGRIRLLGRVGPVVNRRTPALPEGRKSRRVRNVELQDHQSLKLGRAPRPVRRQVRHRPEACACSQLPSARPQRLSPATSVRSSLAATWFSASRQNARPNPSVKARPNGVAPGPRGHGAYHRPRGPGATPSVPPYLKR